MIYVFALSFIMNLVYYFKNFKGSFKLLCFFVVRTLFFILVFNFIFEFMKEIFLINDFDFSVIILIYFISLILYFVFPKYACISYGFFISYFALIGLKQNFFKDGLFMVSSFHLFEGVYVILNSFSKWENNFCKIYLPMMINKIPLIFVVACRRSFLGLKNFSGVISGMVILIYGFACMGFSFLGGNTLFEIILLLVLVLFHENLYSIDKFLNFKFKLK